MDVKEVLRLADRLIFDKTGKHLDDLQEAILRGVCQGNKYSKIAEESHCTEGHVRDVASELWKILSDVLGENVSRANFRSTLERWQVSIISSNFAQDFVGIGNVNICADTLQSPKVTTTPSNKQTSHEDNPIKVRQDLGDAPDVSPFYGRSEELTKLEKWIVQERCRLVTLLGISGIGKTALAVKLVEQIQDKFEYVIWRSLCDSPPLKLIEKNLIQFFSIYQETELPENSDCRLSQLMEYLKKHRCLLILDDVQMVLSSGQLAGNYQPGYENYGLLFRRLGELSHNSCVVLNSWDKPRELAALEGENRPIRSLQLDGLGEAAREILRDKGLAEEETWDKLINTYQANPLWLKIVSTMIQDLFSGRVSEFSKYDTLFLSEELKYYITQQY
ncbi:NB-ARC domain-containing protein [Coleofasciculus sp. H7-2]|uniref:NB-ARC domain-containing protein n=1 Tax=Coleofasciculus sp. H7-2 TaxID=3351545 RepID=UPI00366C1B53